MSRFDFNLGSLEEIGGQPVFVTNRGQLGTPVFGPYTPIGPGRYLATFAIAADPYDTSLSDTICGSVDVAIDTGQTVLARTNIFAARLNGGQTRIELPFELDREGGVELRVHTTGRTRLKVADRTFRRLDDDEATFSPILSSRERPEDAFFLQHRDWFRRLYEAGDNVTLTPQGPMIEIRGVRFYVRNAEDFQIIQETFHVNDYTIRSPRRKIVVDIGMNIGLVSLLMANDPQVIEVHAFEPFAVPFNRALENIALNPALAAKITLHPFGLGGEDTDLDVFADESSTIGTSIRGTTSGRPETIKVRDAAPVLRGILDRAAALDADVFVKVDCEGSEFAIFESLARHGQFKAIRGVLVEWHKWWSPDKTQADLIAPLLAENFVVFDRTRPDDEWAGQFNAVRVSA